MLNKFNFIITAGLLLVSTNIYSQYNVGDVVDQIDNINWTISGPTGHPEVGSSSNIFDMVDSGKPVMIFFRTFF